MAFKKQSKALILFAFTLTAQNNIKQPKSNGFSGFGSKNHWT